MVLKSTNPTVCTLEFEKVDNLNLNGSEPVVKEGLVPVVIANDGTITKTTIDDDNWYDYDEAKWANAVILTSDAPSSLIESNPGTNIEEKYIESYFVWIPKYRYKLFNVEGNEIPSQEIEVEIGDYDTEDNNTTECKATNESGNIGTCKNGMWMTHPAFTSLGVNGLWVGKFEATGTIDKITVKPNQIPLTNINVAAMYNTAYNYKRGLDSHMMKNTEWGTMAYLTNSKYGRPKDENDVPTEVWINNNNCHITGCVGNSFSEVEYSGCQNAYNTTNGYHGSTTDNISGIYDTSGGAWDTMMAVYNNLSSDSGFTESELANINHKYYDKYTGEGVLYKILGDATGETQKWNSDVSGFVDSSRPWYYRGGYYIHSGVAGAFSFYNYHGNGYLNFGFRLVLSPTN